MSGAVTEAAALYFAVGLAIAIGWIVFRSGHAFARAIADRSSGDLDPAVVSRAAALAWIATVVLPLAAHAIRPWLPSLDFAAGGGADAALTRLLERFRDVAAPAGASLAPEGGSNLGAGATMPVSGSVVLVALAVAVACAVAWGGLRTFRAFRTLRRIIDDAVSWRRLGRVSIVVSDRVTVPFSTAVFGRAHIVLPLSVLDDRGLSSVVVRHELEHHRRRDPVWAVALELFRVAFFWNPAGHAWARQIADLQELACDRAVVRRGLSPRRYGACLVRVAEMALGARMVASTPMATTSDRGAQLRRRIDMLVRDASSRPSRKLPLVLGSLTVAAVAATAWATAVTWTSEADRDRGAARATAHGIGSGVASGAGSSGGGIAVASTSGPTASGASGVAAGSAASAGEGTSVGTGSASAASGVGVAGTAATTNGFRTAPEIEFTDGSGAPVRLSELRGKVVLIDFWAAWCQVCTREVPNLAALREELDPAEFEIVGISLSRDRAEFEAFLEEHEVSWPQRHEEAGWDGELARAFGVDAVPGRYLVDREGRVERLPLGDPSALARRIVGAIDGDRAGLVR